MKQFSYKITEAEGIHARPAGLLVKTAKGYPCAVTITKGEKAVNCKQVLGVMSLGVKCGEEITIVVDGEDEDAAYAGIKEMIEANL